jgi:hypothetical protein
MLTAAGAARLASLLAALASGSAGSTMGFAAEIETSDGITLDRKGGNASSVGARVMRSTEPAQRFSRRQSMR